jgi:hypothetical protein
MRISQIEKDIVKLRDELKKQQSLVAKLSVQMAELRALKEQKYRESFLEFIELDSTYEFKSYCSLRGVQTGPKLQSPKSPNFRAGDIIQFVKKNKASIVIKCVKKLVYERDPKTGTNKKVYVDNETYRIEIDSLYHFLITKDDFSKQLITYINRKESLEDLLD